MASQTRPLNDPPFIAKNTPSFDPAKDDSTWYGRPLWQWWLLGGAASLVIIALIMYLLRAPASGYDLIVTNVLPESQVYVDDVKSGIPTADGKIRIPNLKTGSHRFRCSDQLQDNRPVTLDKQGQEVECGKTVVAVKPLPNLITYNGSEMVLVEGGPFPMGENQQPVDVPSFYIDKHEITNTQFKSFCEPRNSCPKYADDSKYFDRDLQSPVIAISYEEAAAYADSVGKKIPTEEQWEKAATWGPGWVIGKQRKKIWPWGDSPRQDVNLVANASENVPRKVGSSPGDKSEYGVLDMGGNVTEWVDGLLDGFRVVRGGQWFDSDINDAKSVVRAPEPRSDPARSDKKRWLVGFRCVVLVSNPQLQNFLRKEGHIN